MIYKYYIIYIKYILHTYKCYIYYNIHMHPDNFLPLLIICRKPYGTNDLQKSLNTVKCCYLPEKNKLIKWHTCSNFMQIWNIRKNAWMSQ